MYTVDELVDMLKQPPSDERRRVTAISSREIASALKSIGIRKSDAQYKVGPYELERKYFDSGPTTSPATATCPKPRACGSTSASVAPTPPCASPSRTRREATVLGRFKHSGVVQLK